jgi:hypothetical protein
MKFFNGYNRSKITFKKPLSSTFYDLLNEQKSIVLKPNTGSGGSGVYKVENKYQVDRALRDLGLGNSFISTKFIPVSKEYRIIMIRDLDKVDFLLCLEKKPLKVKGDGKSTIEELVEKKISELREGVELGSIWEDVKAQLSRYDLKLEEVLPKDFELNIT